MNAWEFFERLSSSCVLSMFFQPEAFNQVHPKSWISPALSSLKSELLRIIGCLIKHHTRHHEEDRHRKSAIGNRTQPEIRWPIAECRSTYINQRSCDGKPFLGWPSDIFHRASDTFAHSVGLVSFFALGSTGMNSIKLAPPQASTLPR